MKRRWFAAAALLAAGAGAAGVLAWRDGGGPDLGHVIARVDGVPVYSSQAETRLESVASGHAEFDVDLAEEWKPRVMQTLVDDAIVRAEADRRGIAVTDDDVDAQVAEVRGAAATGEEFDEWLDGQGITLEELERRVELKLTWGRVQQAVVADVTVEDDAVAVYYRRHREDFRTANGVRPLFEVRPSIEETLLGREQDRTFTAWLDDRRAAVEVELLDDEWEWEAPR